MYHTDSDALGGIVKLRYWDFVVQEMYTENGKQQTAQIVDFEVPQTDFNKLPENTNNYDFLYVDVQKMNTDLQNVIKSFALIMQCGKSRIGTAGLKDKRAVTCQRISLYQPNLELLLKKFKKNMVKMHNFRWQENKVEIGDLIGNKFTIILRGIDKDKKEINKIIAEFGKQIDMGIPNKFGEQRFGGIRNVTHEVGKMFVQGKLKEAVLHYLTKTVDKEPDDVKESRKLVAEGDYKSAFKKFPREGYRYELAILNRLMKENNNFVGAWQQLPKNIVYLFTHAYQSYLYNRYLDLRQKEFGQKMFDKQPGDVIDENGNVMGPLFGYDFVFADGKGGEIEKDILKEESLSLENFEVKGFPQMSVSGTRRQIKLNVYGFKLLEIGEDEFNSGKKFIKIEFWLDKGNYATVVLDELIKENNKKEK